MVWYFYFLCGNSQPVSKSRLCCNSFQHSSTLALPYRKRNCRWTYCAAAVSVVNEDFAHVFCCAGNGIAAEQQQEFHFWARLISCPGSSIPTLCPWVSNRHFRILTQRVTFETWDPSDIWSGWWGEKKVGEKKLQLFFNFFSQLIILIKCLKGLKSQKSLFVSKF